MKINSLEDRENLKKQAAELREAGELKKSLELFNTVVDWDENNSNLRGAVDVLGHIRIVYTRLSDNETEISKKLEYMQAAKDALEKATHLAKSAEGTENALPEGPLATLEVHKAATILTCALLKKGENYSEELQIALDTINDAMAKLPGSIAHKAWPTLAKSRILAELGRVDEALEAIDQGERFLYEGYEPEMASPDQGLLKLKVWQSGLFLGKAEIYAKQGKSVMARHYASAILAIDDPDNNLVERKKDAQRILDALGVTVIAVSVLLNTIFANDYVYHAIMRHS